MMIVNKNDLTKSARVLVTYLGYTAIACGLALPAYGGHEVGHPPATGLPEAWASLTSTGAISPNCPKVDASGMPVDINAAGAIKSGAIAITGVTTSDTGNPSSYADVCNAVAGTDDSLAIGDSAKVELYEGAAP